MMIWFRWFSSSSGVFSGSILIFLPNPRLPKSDNGLTTNFPGVSPGPLHHLVLKELCLITKVSCLIPDHNHQNVMGSNGDQWEPGSMVISGIRDQWWSVGSGIYGDQWDHLLINYLGGFLKWWYPTTKGFSYEKSDHFGVPPFKETPMY